MTFLIILGLFILLVVLVIIIGREIFFSMIYNTKRKIAAYYGISKPTLNKWILYCCPEIDYEQWINMKKISSDNCLTLLKKFGFKKATAKADLLEELNTSYPTLRADLKAAGKKLGLTIEAINSMNKYPSNVANNFIKHLNIN